MPFQSPPRYPPFPDNVPTVPLLRLSLAKLLAGDQAQSDRLFSACRGLGFFLLDFQDTSQGLSILNDLETLSRIGAETFDLDLEEKQCYKMRGDRMFGYKSLGVGKVDAKGSPDRCEMFNVSKDDILSVSEQLPQPETITRNRQLLKNFTIAVHGLAMHLLGHLDLHLHLKPGTLANLHRLHKRGDDHVRFIKYAPQPPDDRRTSLGAHTDFGSITVLFSTLGGLQILPSGPDAQWGYVRPESGHAIINIGDALVKFTNGLLRSNIHRVTYAPGAQAELVRYSLGYFVRPEDDVVLKRLDGGDVIPPLVEGEVEDNFTAKEWTFKRANQMRRENPQPESITLKLE